MSESVVYNMDCMEYMKTLPDNAFDIAVVDPPYGDACSQTAQVEREREKRGRHGQGKNVKQPDGTWGYAKGRFLTTASAIPEAASSGTSGGAI